MYDNLGECLGKKKSNREIRTVFIKTLNLMTKEKMKQNLRKKFKNIQMFP